MQRLHTLHLIGYLLIALSLVMLFPLAWSLFEGGADSSALLVSALITGLVGMIVCLLTPFGSKINLVESFALVTLAWFIAGFFGALPYHFYGLFDSFTAAYFESISGFTTTGATLIIDVEAVPAGLLLWRSLTQWLGGMGIIALFVALLPRLGLHGMNLFRAEVPGVFADRVVPRVAEMARKLWYIYVVLTILQTALLMLSGLPFYHALNHALTTMPTGGFSTLNGGIASLGNPAAEIIIIVFMLVAAVNFALYYQLLRGDFKSFFRNPELRFYLSFVLLAVILVAFNIYSHYGVGDTIRHAAFQVSSIVSTTGFSSIDFDSWPVFSKALLFTCMFIGGPGGSTAGGIKLVRIMLLFKFVYREIYRFVHPAAVTTVKLGHRPIPEEILRNAVAFIFMYMSAFVLGALVLAGMGLDPATFSSAAAASLGNIGAGFGLIGSAAGYGSIPLPGLCVLCFLMVLGRLEIYTVLVFFLVTFRKLGRSN
ncbi:MAG: TrkH family potassium uptake protein [Firmicutes bacterium]|nr:TrkH family potassium uptake protein [Bacillota bacterium]